MDLTVETPDATHAIFRMDGELVIAECPTLRSDIMEYIEKGAKQVTIDLNGVSFIDSAGLGLLIGLRQAVRQRDGELSLVGVNERILPLFQMTRLDKVFGLSP